MFPNRFEYPVALLPEESTLCRRLKLMRPLTQGDSHSRGCKQEMLGWICIPRMYVTQTRRQEGCVMLVRRNKRNLNASYHQLVLVQLEQPERWSLHSGTFHILRRIAAHN